MKKQLIELIESINDPKILSLLYGIAKEFKKREVK